MKCTNRAAPVMPKIDPIVSPCSSLFVIEDLVGEDNADSCKQAGHNPLTP